jgi:tetrahydromethanopterin S-methyltransferase subunit G
LISQNKDDPVVQVDRGQDIEQMIKRLNMFDERLDNVDTVVTSLVERVMGRPLTIQLSCPKCGQPIQVDITSSVRLRD